MKLVLYLSRVEEVLRFSEQALTSSYSGQGPLLPKSLRIVFIITYEFNSLTLPSQEQQTGQRARWKDSNGARRK